MTPVALPELPRPMDYERLTAQQALELATVKEENADLKDRLDKIHMMLVCIGGPLNDNVLGFNEAQRRLLHRIDELANLT